MKKDHNSEKKSEPRSKRTKSPGAVRRDTKEVLAELVVKLKEKLDSKKVAAIPSDWFRRAEAELMKREPKSIQNLWQTTTSTALFGDCVMSAGL